MKVNEENKCLHSIIKEVREYIYNNSFDEERKEIVDELWVNEIKDILEILDKEHKQIYGDKLNIEWFEESILDKENKE